MTNISVY